MSKDTYYFSHDYDPTGDPKMAAMVGEYGAIGYGIFWRIVEMLHADSTHRLPMKKYIFQAIAKQLLSGKKQIVDIGDLPEFVENFIKDCIGVYELFTLSEDSFSSNRVFRHFEKKQKISELRSEIGKIRAIAKQKKYLPFAKKQNGAKESKVNESNININSGEFVCRDAEYYILNNNKIFEKLCIATSKGSEIVKKELHAYHLWMVKKQNYPTTESVVEAGFETWLLNGNDYKKKYNASNSNELEIKNKKLFI